MALAQVFAGTTNAINLATATEFEMAGPVTIVAGKLSPPTGGKEESITAYVKTLSGDFEILRPPIVLNHEKNTDVIYGTVTVKFVKTETKESVDLGHE